MASALSPLGSEPSAVPDLDRDFAWAREELSSAARRLTHVQEWLAHGTQTFQEESRALRSELSELRAQRINDSETIESLRRENEALNRRVDPLTNAAVAKLRRTRQTLRDLLEETEVALKDITQISPNKIYGRDTEEPDLSFPPAGSTPEGHGRYATAARDSGSISPRFEQIPDMPSEDMLGLSGVRMGKKRPTSGTKLPMRQEGSRVIADPPKSGSEDTADKKEKGKGRATSVTATPPRAITPVCVHPSPHELSQEVTPKVDAPVIPVRGPSSGRSTSAASTRPGSSSRTHYEADTKDSTTSPSESVSGFSAAVMSQPETTGSARKIKRRFVQWTKPPAACKRPFGALSVEDLRIYLHLGFDTITELTRLPLVKEHRMRVMVDGKRAFLYEPFILETPSSSYLIDWGTDDTNRETERYILGEDEAATENWFYIGALRWKRTQLRDVWKTLVPKAKHQLTVKLRDRCPEGPGVADLAEMLNTQQLKQLIFHLDADQHIDSSCAFAEELTERMQMRRGPGSP
ncbi:hypothetical protein GLOTRDRAFT_136063 [Gloeophyllum trabeum ATCC 11539]|uniref:Uncharacterized protein n=1 Tax=Gloeophyllum trabeum (strain ATCC 11539 / FP-39264 / Madison 617) TaxID=670483 RepID=S7QH31_GLOTA|nr:uncharacterized protein GLOTRDRAFT_136063 [Gloeophyllum trabeum ATCC 11539]EPQ59101.1 hypothetical protein GLOTRDRAFT_136063 [Gloeophyllum trabeum ATCC 11539]